MRVAGPLADGRKRDPNPLWESSATLLSLWVRTALCATRNGTALYTGENSTRSVSFASAFVRRFKTTLFLLLSCDKKVGHNSVRNESIRTARSCPRATGVFGEFTLNTVVKGSWCSFAGKSSFFWRTFVQVAAFLGCWRQEFKSV